MTCIYLGFCITKIYNCNKFCIEYNIKYILITSVMVCTSNKEDLVTKLNFISLKSLRSICSWQLLNKLRNIQGRKQRLRIFNISYF